MEAAVAATEALSLEAYRDEIAGCTKCALAKGRTQVVFGSGSPTAELMFVGEAPGFHEDKQGVPFVGAAGKLLEQLLAGIGLSRSDVYIANVLKCRPPGNRDPMPEEIEACEGHLWHQIELMQPRVVATLGGRRVLLYPLYHPAAALYTPRMLDVLQSDFRRIPELMGREIAPPTPVLASVAAEPAVQLGLF